MSQPNFALTFNNEHVSANNFRLTIIMADEGERPRVLTIAGLTEEDGNTVLSVYDAAGDLLHEVTGIPDGLSDLDVEIRRLLTQAERETS